ncbi:hypothetical protein BGZ76_008025 [Entomortierella beljakovae]|nr:hypothetical protein BGZ76_008025 [Entomortierella beljakovae]
MKHRIRKINDYYEDQVNLNQDGQPVSKPLPPSPHRRRTDNGAGVGSWIVRRLSGRHERDNPAEMDTSGLLNHNFNEDGQQNFSDIDLGEDLEMQGIRQNKADQPETVGHEIRRHHYSLKERMHCQRPDRHLFPYRTKRENWHAIKTFFRRFYLILLIIPGWIIPFVLEAQARNALIHEAELKGEEVDDDKLEKIELSKVANSVVFFLNLLAMTHLGKAAGACMEELVPKLGMSIVSIFDAMTSSSVELAVAAFALAENLVEIVQAAMLGAILNNLLLIMGVSFCVGGAYHHQQEIQSDTSQTGVNLLMIVTISYAVPRALDYTLTDLRHKQLPHDLEGDDLEKAIKAITEQVDIDIWDLSKVMAVIMLLLYGCCLLYQYNCRHFLVTPEAKHSEEYTVHKRNTHYWFAGWAYGAALAAQIYSAKLLVHSVEVLGEQFGLNHSFIGFILLPIVLVADLQEEVIAIKESRANRLDRTIALMIGSCMQIALLVTPLLVLLGWAMDVPMTFRFSLLETIVLGGSVLIVNYLLVDNVTNWFEGALLLAVYFMCAVAFYYQDPPHHGVVGAGGGEGGGGGGGHG